MSLRDKYILEGCEDFISEGCQRRSKPMQIENIKHEAGRILNSLPGNATWDDLVEQIYVPTDH